MRHPYHPPLQGNFTQTATTILKVQIISENSNIHPKQITGNYSIKYTKCYLSAKWDKKHVWRMANALHLPFISHVWKKKTIAEILAFYKITASQHIQGLKKTYTVESA